MDFYRIYCDKINNIRGPQYFIEFFKKRKFGKILSGNEIQIIVKNSNHKAIVLSNGDIKILLNET